MVGCDDNTFHPQVTCPSGESEWTMCSNLPGGMCK